MRAGKASTKKVKKDKTATKTRLIFPPFTTTFDLALYLL
jgi:hypothetical protein